MKDGKEVAMKNFAFAGETKPCSVHAEYRFGILQTFNNTNS